MKRNDLRAMGLTPDQIDTIMTMNLSLIHI